MTDFLNDRSATAPGQSDTEILELIDSLKQYGEIVKLERDSARERAFELERELEKCRVSVAPLPAQESESTEDQIEELKNIAEVRGDTIDRQKREIENLLAANENLTAAVAGADGLEDQLKLANERIEILNMQLVACSVAAFQNTRQAAKNRIARDNPYWSVAYSEVCEAVDREMGNREDAEAWKANHKAIQENAEYAKAKAAHNKYASHKEALQVQAGMIKDRDREIRDLKSKLEEARAQLHHFKQADLRAGVAYMGGLEQGTEAAEEKIKKLEGEVANRKNVAETVKRNCDEANRSALRNAKECDQLVGWFEKIRIALGAPEWSSEVAPDRLGEVLIGVATKLKERVATLAEIGERNISRASGLDRRLRQRNRDLEQICDHLYRGFKIVFPKGTIDREEVDHWEQVAESVVDRLVELDSEFKNACGLLDQFAKAWDSVRGFRLLPVDVVDPMGEMCRKVDQFLKQPARC